MKKFSKYKTKKGFTLLEVLLATAILVIISSMLMEGFISAMGFSYNSSVYSRSASYNGDLCRTQLAKWSTYSRHISSYDTSHGKYVDLEAAYKDVGEYVLSKGSYSSNPTPLTGTLYFPQYGALKTLGRINVAVYEKKDVGITAATLGSFHTETIDNSENRRADNRTVLFYYPANNGTYGATGFGNTHLYKINGSKVWCYETYKTKADGSYDLDENGNKIVSKITEINSGTVHNLTK